MRSFGIVTPLVSLACLVLAQGCGAPVDGEEAETLDSQSQELYYISSAIWPTNIIGVCWEATPAAEATQRKWVRDQVTRAYETETGVQFTGWNKCTATSKGIRILVDDQGPKSLLGTNLDGRVNGMILNFTFKVKNADGQLEFPICTGREEACIRGFAVHEFGHALGYSHEHNRPDTPASCTIAPQGPNGDAVYGVWDLNSVMNYCNPLHNNGGFLSPTDLAGTKVLYGERRYRPELVLADFGLNAGQWSTTDHVRLAGDVDGDRRSDIVGFGNQGVFTARSTGVGFDPAVLRVANFGYDQGWRVNMHPRLLGDLNADGKQDIVGFFNDGVWVSYASTNGTFSPAVHVLEDFGYDQAWRVAKHPRMLGDLNNDQRQDIIAFGHDGIWIAYANPNGIGFSTPVLEVLDLGYDQAWRTTAHPRFVTDVNGDGRQDVVGFGQDGVWVSLATATGLSPAVFSLVGFAPNAGGWAVDKHPRFMADVNGDKRSDIVGFGQESVMVSLSTGSGFSPPAVWKLGAFCYGQGTQVDKHQRFVTDVTGDGRADIVAFHDVGMFVAPSTGTDFGGTEFRIRNLGYNAGWRPNQHPIVMADVTDDGTKDAIGFGYDGVWQIMGSKQVVSVRPRPQPLPELPTTQLE